jgi:DNA mismatch repair protein PMS2
VVDLQTAVKEMVENSLDAGATTIGESKSLVRLLPAPKLSPEEVRFRDHGLKSIEVVDNGSGISARGLRRHWLVYRTITHMDLPFVVGLKHHTSKLSSFEDLTTVSSFGFRGEAISSLCALSESVTITTATTSEAPMGTVIELDRSGKVTSRSTKVARQVCIPFLSQRERSLTRTERDHGNGRGTLQTTPCPSERSLSATPNASSRRR